MAGSRDLKINIDADPAKAEAGIQRVTRATMRMETQLRQADLAAADLDRQLAAEGNRAAQQRAQSMERLGRGLVLFGAATVAGLGLAAKAAIDWESAWAGVRKTVEGSPEEMAALQGELRGLTEILPASHREIAAVAEAAGQLGVQRGAIAAFTKVMIDLGETTNLTADEAATAIAQLGNVMGLDLKNDVDNFGAALVALGNDGASTEADILSMAQRIAGAGATVGMSAQDVLGLAAALSNVGIEAEAGGSAISRVMVDMAQSVETGSEKLDIFAETAGMTGAEFAAAFREDPAAAIDAFVSGLGQMDAAGGNVFGTLEQLGLSGIRVRDALLRLSQSQRGVATDLDLSNRAWEENRALIEEAGKRYDTNAAKIELARNALVNLAIDVGGVLLPAIGQLAESGADLLQWFTDLPGPVKTAVTVFGALAGTSALVAGSFLLLAPRIKAAIDLLIPLARNHMVAAGAMLYMGQAVSRLSMFGAATAAVWGLIEATKEAAPSVEQATEALLNFHDASQRVALDQLIRQANDLREFGNRNWFEIATDSLFSFGSANLQAVQDTKEFEETLNSFDRSIASMVQSGNMDLAEEKARLLFAELGKTGDFEDLVQKHLPEYADALLNADNQQQITAESAGQVAEGMGEVAGSTDEAAKAVEDLIKRWSESLAGAVDPLAAWEAANQSAAETAAEAAGEGKEAWQDFADEVSASFDQYLAELEKQVTAQQNWQTNLALIAGKVTPAVLDALIGMGPAAAPLIQEMVDGTQAQFDQLNTLLPHSLESTQVGIAEELRKWNQVAGPIAAEFGQEVADKIAVGIGTGQTTLDQALADLNLKIDDSVPDQITTKVDLDPSDFFLKAETVSEDIAALNAGRPLPQIGLDTSRFFDGSLSASQDMKVLAKQKPTPKANLDINPFQNRVGTATGDIRGLHKQRPYPVANLDIRKVRTGKTQAQTTINSLRGKTVKAGADVFGKRAVDGLKSSINSLRSRTVTITTNHKVIGPGFSGSLAHGGPVEMGRMYEVGEQGRELFIPHADGRIIPHGRTESILSALESARGGFGSSRSSSGGIDRMLARTAQQVVRLGDVTRADWQALLRAGWRGRAGDGLEALYPPLRITGREFARFGEVTNAEWRALLAMGWRGKAGDHMEALYAPMGRAAAAFDRLADDTNKIAGGLKPPSRGTGPDKPSRLEDYAARLLKNIQGGGKIFEDFTSPGVRFTGTDRLNEQLAALFFKANPGFDFGPGGTRDAVMRWLMSFLGGGSKKAASLDSAAFSVAPATMSMSVPMASPSTVMARMDPRDMNQLVSAMPSTLRLQIGGETVLARVVDRGDRINARRA